MRTLNGAGEESARRRKVAAVPPQHEHVVLALLDDMPVGQRAKVVADLEATSILPGQSAFSLPPTAVLEKSRTDPSRRTFAILLHHDDGMDAVGIGVLQPCGAGAAAWPEQTPHVLLRGFSVDARWQGRGIGTRATNEAVMLARREFPEAQAIVLTVHVDNLAGQRAYERTGFRPTGRQVSGRAGQELVMARWLDGSPA